MDTSTPVSHSSETPPQGYISLTYASSAGQKSGILISHGRILALLLGSLFLTVWFFVSTLGTAALVLVPSLRKSVFSILVSPSPSSSSLISHPPSPLASDVLPKDKEDALVLAPFVLAEKRAGESLEEVSVPQVYQESLTQTQEVGSSLPPSGPATPSEKIPTATAMPPEVMRFDRINLDVGSSKLEFKFYLNLIQKGKKHTGRIMARAEYRAQDGKLFYVASTLEGGEVYASEEEGKGIPFTMKQAVRHDLVFFAPHHMKGEFTEVRVKAFSDFGGAPAFVSMKSM